MIEKEKILFPHNEIRNIQEELIMDIVSALGSKKNIIVHAPTGLGKTAAALSPCLKFAIDNGLNIFFLTSRHTQHMIAIETLKEIQRKYKEEFNVADIIGKKWMCLISGITGLYTADFAEYCKNMKANNKCEYYFNTRKGAKLSVEAKKIIEDTKGHIHDIEEIKKECEEKKVCPYEIIIEIAKKSNVIIADYYYMFNETISEQFLSKTSKEIEKAIIIVDEAHNLPARIRNLASARLTSFMIRKAVKEAKKYRYEETIGSLTLIQDILLSIVRDIKEGSERRVKKEEFIRKINEIKDYDELIADFEFIAADIRERQKQSSIGSIASFLKEWNGQDEGFARIASIKQFKKESMIVLSYTCLDPSIVSKSVFEKAYSGILMSGTLTPTNMYRDLLGISNCIEKEYPNPFPQENRLNLIIPRTTTKFTLRCSEQYKNIAEACSNIVNAVPGNCIIFFPSYSIRDYVAAYFNNICRKTTFMEEPNLTKEEKTQLLERFKKYKDNGAVLLGCASGSFGEGIDLPGDLLKCVVVVGLPLQQPDLEIKELINYFDKKYSKGWDYGYLFPAFQKCLQNAGRCIRSETDKGIIVFLDERYIWPNYYRCFPKDWKLVVKKDFLGEINNFFKKNN